MSLRMRKCRPLLPLLIFSEENIYRKCTGSVGRLNLVVMCAGAAFWTQVGTVGHGASDPKRGLRKTSKNIRIRKTKLISGIMQEECGELVERIFQEEAELYHTFVARSCKSVGKWFVELSDDKGNFQKKNLCKSSGLLKPKIE